MLQYDFDGLSLDWQYPAMRGGRPEDRPNFTLLVKVIVARQDLLLCIRVPTLINFDPVHVEGKTCYD